MISSSSFQPSRKIMRKPNWIISWKGTKKPIDHKKFTATANSNYTPETENQPPGKEIPVGNHHIHHVQVPSSLWGCIRVDNLVRDTEMARFGPAKAHRSYWSVKKDNFEDSSNNSYLGIVIARGTYMYIHRVPVYILDYLENCMLHYLRLQLLMYLLTRAQKNKAASWALSLSTLLEMIHLNLAIDPHCDFIHWRMVIDS